MSTQGTVPSLEIHGRLATITLRRPDQANRLDDTDLAVLHEHFETVDAHPEVLVLRLRATGRYFCSGYNVDSFAAPGASTVSFEQVANRLEQVRAITIAALNGGLFGGATDLALACDFRIGVTSCRMFVPAARLGLHFYQSGMERLVSRLGLNMAKRILLAAEEFDAEQLLASGFLTHCVEDVAALDAEVENLSERLAGMAPLSLRGMKRHLNALGHGGIDPALFAEDRQQADASEDLREGARAWREKRRPVFKGR